MKNIFRIMKMRKKSARSHSRIAKAGVTIVEVSIAMAITGFTCAGLYTMGITMRRGSERMRIATEAQSYAKQALEEIISVGARNLSLPTLALRQPSTIEASTGAPVSRSVQIVWHDNTGTVATNYVASGYAEVHVNVAYPAPRSGTMLTDTYSTLIN